MSPEQRLAVDGQTTVGARDEADDTKDVWTDAGALAALICAGADLSEPRHVMHYLYVLSEGAAYQVAAELSARGWYVDIAGPEGGEDDWLVLAQDLAMVVDEAKLRETRLAFQDLAHRYVGEYEGWEASV